jgi:phospholipid/cholesterol/gamma-HCH transport system permease protein
MKTLLTFFEAFGQICILAGRAFREMFRAPFEFRLTLTQLEQGGVDSWSITVLTAAFTGMVMASQFAWGLAPFGASLYTGKLVSLGIVRELGPVLTSLLVGGRVGAGFTAELGSMAVTEQIDAIRALGADPVRKLVVPRVLAMVVSIPLLTVLADIVGCAGGILMTMLKVGVTFRFAMQQVNETIEMGDLLHGIIKSCFFGGIIALIACWNGMRTHGGTEGVGRATTTTVVYTSITLLVSDFILSSFLMAIYA